MRLSFEFSNVLGAVYHKGTIKFGPDGFTIYSPVGNKVIVYDLKANRHDALPLQVSYNIEHLTIHPKGTLLLAASEKSHLYMVSLVSGRLLHVKEYRSFPIISHISFSPDGRYYCVCGDNFGIIYITPGSIISGKGREILPFRVFKKLKINHDKIVDVSWTAESSHICFASQDSTLNIWSLSDQGRNVVQLRGHTDPILNCHFSKSESLNHQLYSVTSNCCLSIWDEKEDDDDTVSEKQVKKVKKSLYFSRISKHYLRLTLESDESKEERYKKSKAYITSTDFNPNSKLLVVGYNTGHYSLFEMPSVQLIYQLDSNFGSINSISINPLGDWIALGSSVQPEVDSKQATNKTQSRLLVWEWQSKSHILDQVGSGCTMSNFHECVSYSPDGSYIVSGNLAGRIKVWNSLTGEIVATFGEEHTASIKSIKFAPNKSGKVIISASIDGTIRAFDLNKFKNFRKFSSPVSERRPEFICLDIDSTGEFIAAGTYNYFDIYLYSLQTGRFLEYLTGHEGPVSGVAFSPVSNVLVSTSWDSTARIWNLFEGPKCMRDSINFAHEVITLAFRPDGNQFAVSLSNGQIALINPHTAEQYGAPIEGLSDLGTTHLISELSRDTEKYFTTLNYSADGTYIIAAGKSNNICIYHAGQKILIKKFSITFNKSMDGVLDYISKRRRNEFGLALETLETRQENRGPSDQVIKLPGVRTGDLGDRKALPVIATYQIVFSPTMRSFAASTTEGVLVFSIDKSRHFDPYKLVEGVDPSSVRRSLKSKSYGLALVASIQLNEIELIKEVIESIPITEIDSIIANMDFDYVSRLLDFISRIMSKIRHLEFYLTFAKKILYKHGLALKSQPQSQTASIIRTLHQNSYSTYTDLKKNCDYCRYSLEYLTSLKTDKEQDFDMIDATNDDDIPEE